MEWISVKDRMPADEGYKGHVLLTRVYPFIHPQFDTDRDVTTGFMSVTGWRNDFGLVEIDGSVVTHWMPIPEPDQTPQEEPPVDMRI